MFHVSEHSPIVREIGWTKNTSMLDLSNEKYHGGTLAETCLKISSSGEEDKGVYTCTVLNAAGSDSKHVKLG